MNKKFYEEMKEKIKNMSPDDAAKIIRKALEESRIKYTTKKGDKVIFNGLNTNKEENVWKNF